MTPTAERDTDTDAGVGSVIVAGVVALSLLLAPLALTGSRPVVDRGPRPAELVAAVADGYLGAWERGDLAAMREMVVAPPPEFDDVHQAVAERLHVDAARFLAGSPEVSGATATVPFVASLDLAGLGTWDYDGRLDLVLGVHEPPVFAQDVVDAGTALDPVPGRSAPEAVSSERPRWAVSWSPTAIHPALGPGWALHRWRERPARAPLLGVGGVPLTGEGAPPLPALSAQVLGSVAPADDAAAAALGALHLPGDAVGTSGLQAALEARLAGRPSGAVQLVDDTGREVEVLHRFAGEAAPAVHTTFDAEMQAAAEAALSRSAKPAALVAVDAPTGQIRAVASRPTAGFSRALVGQYPPGSTFKVVTSAALLSAGIAADTTTSCPATASIGGFRFSNAGGEALGEIPFMTAFSHSCNTAFVQLAAELDPAALRPVAESFGFNHETDLPVPAGAGSFPEPSGPVDLAAAAIGQGRVTATPLQMAMVAAAVASGSWHPPQMLVSHTPPPARSLPPDVAETLRQLMRLAGEDGTGTAAFVAGEPVGGKTGTAEYGSARPPRSHAWFIGFRGDVAVAVIVEDGGFGGSVAAPIARAFLSGF